MENFFKFLKLDSLLAGIKGYIEARIQLFKLEMQEKASNVIATAIFILMVAFCAIMTMIFLSLALGFYLGHLFGNNYAGFLIIGLFYLVVLIIFGANISKGAIHSKVKKTIFKAMHGKTEKEGKNG
jgi:lipopolysaccharide export LptBFGC system permease protein LptF